MLPLIDGLKDLSEIQRGKIHHCINIANVKG